MVHIQTIFRLIVNLHFQLWVFRVRTGCNEDRVGFFEVCVGVSRHRQTPLALDGVSTTKPVK